ncbi:unnamed protein product [Arctogadus glacialis]
MAVHCPTTEPGVMGVMVVAGASGLSAGSSVTHVISLACRSTLALVALRFEEALHAPSQFGSLLALFLPARGLPASSYLRGRRSEDGAEANRVPFIFPFSPSPCMCGGLLRRA